MKPHRRPEIRDPRVAIASPGCRPPPARRGPRLLHAVAAGLLVGGAGAAPAHARERAWRLDAGAFVGIHFGLSQPIRMTGGLEVRGIDVNPLPACGGRAEPFWGGFLRAALVGREPRLLAGGIGGRMDESFAVGIEGGAGLRLGSEIGPLVHVGMDGSVAGFVNGKAGFAVLRDVSLAAGLRLPTRRVGGCAVEGRPQRDGRGVPALPEVAFAEALDGEDRDPVVARAAARWLRRAAAEWGSIPAFLALAEDLAAVGAPPALRERALAAAADELGHALVAAQVAAALAGREVWLPPSPGTARRPAGQGGLEGLIFESWVDGVVGEAAAADAAAHEAAGARSPALRRALAGIAAEEGTHAALAADVLRWAVREGGARGAAALRAAIALTAAGPSAEDLDEPGDDDRLAPLGCLPATAWPALQRAAHERAAAFARRALT